MRVISKRILLTIALAALAAPIAAAEAPTPSLKKALEALKLGPETMAGVERELAVPPAWVDGAKKEGTVRVRLNISPADFAPIGKAFAERYPGVSVDYALAVGRARGMDPLLAFKNGAFISDVVYGFDTLHREFEKAKALLDLRDLPTFGSISEKYRDPNGLSIAFTLTFWCLAYNTEKVKKVDLPKTWDDLITSPRFRNGAVGMASRPNLWLSNLWGVKGDAWTDHYMAAVFSTLRPQLRKESQSGLLTLLNLGEFDVAIPAYPDGVLRRVEKGAKIGFHCPEPVPSAYNSFGILPGNPHLNASRLFINWYLSKEGQIVAYHAAGLIPAHKDLVRPEFFPYYDTIAGKADAPYTQRVLDKTSKIVEKWNELWMKSSGPKTEN